MNEPVVGTLMFLSMLRRCFSDMSLYTTAVMRLKSRSPAHTSPACAAEAEVEEPDGAENDESEEEEAEEDEAAAVEVMPRAFFCSSHFCPTASRTKSERMSSRSALLRHTGQAPLLESALRMHTEQKQCEQPRVTGVVYGAESQIGQVSKTSSASMMCDAINPRRLCKPTRDPLLNLTLT